MTKMEYKTLIVIPAYNEEATIKKVVERAKVYADICVVNDGSKDRTKEIVEAIPGVVCINHIKNTHIPQTILDGMKYALENNYHYIITLDAGLSHNPDELPLLINEPPSDLVVGVRVKKEGVPLFRNLLSKIATFLINKSLRPAFSNLPKAKFTDITSGYRRYSHKSAELLLNRKMKAKTFDFLTESFMFVYRNNLHITEVPISYKFSNSSLNLKVVFDGLLMYLDFFIYNRK
jgi:dolichol-phosphate mannosyltransferase